jgi:hypothetical protein
MSALRTERLLDKAFEAELKNPLFASWLLSRTKFGLKNATYRWSRSDNPWGRVKITVPNAETGRDEQIVKESETDILVVFEDLNDHTRFALHIENKIASPFTWRQPEMYRERAQQWSGKSKWGSYVDHEVILIAPQKYYDRYQSDCSKFEEFISHEDISRWLPVFLSG